MPIDVSPCNPFNGTCGDGELCTLSRLRHGICRCRMGLECGDAWSFEILLGAVATTGELMGNGSAIIIPRGVVVVVVV